MRQQAAVNQKCFDNIRDLVKTGSRNFAVISKPPMHVLFERLPFDRRWREFLPLIIYLGVFAALILGWKLAEPLIFAGSPYEAWDECMGYTQATRMSLTTRFQNTTYGSIEEFKFRIAKFLYKYFDPVGKHLTPRRWSNNVLTSYVKPSAIFESLSFDGTYSRGILDRQPFIIARYVNTIGALILGAVLCCFWLVKFRYQALFLIVPLLWFLVSLGYLTQAVVVTPNAWNALLSIMVFVSLTDVIERRRPVGLYISAALLGFGANSKIDFLFLGAPVVVTWIVADLEARTWSRRWIRPALLCVLFFLAALFLTNPRLLYALPLAIGEQVNLLGQVRSDTPSETSSIAYNHLVLLKEFLTECLGIPWDVAKLHSLSSITALAICLLFPLCVIFSSNVETRQKLSMLVILSFFYVSLWLMPLLLAGAAYDRYFLSGSAVTMISVGYGCLYLWRENSRFSQSLALLGVCLCAIFYMRQAKDVGFGANYVKEQLGREVFIGPFSRNEAVSKMIKWIEGGNYSRRVIIDQHSYTDVRAFLEKGIPVTLTNVFNYRRELKKLEGANKPTLGLYVPGKGEGPQEWEGKWNDEECSLYDRYLKYLSSFETVAKFGNHPMFLLDWGPVNPADEVVVFETKPAPSSPEVRPE